MTTYSEFFLNTESWVVPLELIEISHPNFSQTYRVVRNNCNGVTAKIDGSYENFIYYPLKISGLGFSSDMDQTVNIDLGDTGDILPTEMDLISAASGFSTKPKVRLWVFRSDDLDNALEGPVVLEITNLSFKDVGASFEATTPSLGLNKTGELYRIPRFPMLKGLL